MLALVNSEPCALRVRRVRWLLRGGAPTPSLTATAPGWRRRRGRRGRRSAPARWSTSTITLTGPHHAGGIGAGERVVADIDIGVGIQPQFGEPPQWIMRKEAPKCRVIGAHAHPVEARFAVI